MSVKQPLVSPPRGFSIRIRPERDRVVVALGGELDLATSERAERWARALYERGFTSLAFDLRDLTFIDSSGIRLLLTLDELAACDGFRFAIVERDGPVRRLLQLTGLTDHFQRAAPSVV